jgi:hypothetical protein
MANLRQIFYLNLIEIAKCFGMKLHLAGAHMHDDGKATEELA